MTNFPPVRRQDRLLGDDRAIELLETGEYGFLSVGIDDNGYAYGVPLNFAYDKAENALYFHCAPEGHKLDVLKENKKVTFCVVGYTEPIAGKFTTLYESVMVFGQADVDLSDEEKRKALRLLVNKYSADYKEVGEKYMEKSFHRTTAIKIVIEHMSAKSKSVSK